MFGSWSARRALATASARTLPAAIIWAIRPGSGTMPRSMRSASISVVIGARPLNGTCSRLTPALVLNSSPARWAPEPLPVEPKVSLPGSRFGERHQVGDAFDVEAVAGHQHVRHRGDAGDRREIAHRVIGAVLDQALVGGVGLVGAEDQGVAVGLGMRHRVGADDAGAARPVLHHDRLAEIGLLGDQPRQQVDRPAGRVGHHDGDRAGRKRLRTRGRRDGERGERGEGGAAGEHAGVPGFARSCRPPQAASSSIPCASRVTVVPASPRSSAGVSWIEPIAARPPVSSTNEHAARTFGPMIPRRTRSRRGPRGRATDRALLGRAPVRRRPRRRR